MLPHQNKQFCNSVSELMLLMKNTMQFETQSVYDHGLSVNYHYNYLISIFRGWKEDIFDLPSELHEWFDRNYQKLFDETTTEIYHIFHDCGKPLCLSYDENGRKHFYNHDNISAEQYKLINPYDDIIYALIKNDMKYHFKESPDIPDLYKPTLFLTAWAELLANSIMFGGIESISYKIKKKNLIKHLKRGI